MKIVEPQDIISALNLGELCDGVLHEEDMIVLKDGTRLFASPAIVEAYKTFGRCVRENRINLKDRYDAFKLEKEIMGNVVYAPGYEIFYTKERRPGKIIKITRVDIPALSIFEHPYYVVHLAKDGVYRLAANGEPLAEDCALLYARDFRDYGLTLRRVA